MRLRIYKICESMLGDDHPDTLKAMHDLAYTYLQLDRLEEARDLHIRVLDAIWRGLLGQIRY